MIERPFIALALAASILSTSAPVALAGDAAPTFRVQPGLLVEKVAAQPLVQYPLFACFDDRGRLYVAEGTGINKDGQAILPLKLGKIAMIEDTDGDGKFDKRTVFADQLVFPQGVLWRDGSIYVASHPAIWKLTDTNGDGVADKREEFAGKFGFTGNGCDIHGPFSGPDGWLYWTQGRHGYKLTTRERKYLEGLATRVWRCRPNGADTERVCGGGFDNPVELAFTETGDLCGTGDQYPGDMLLQYVYGGVYPRPDEPTLAEFPRTGPLLPPLVGFSAAYPAALCGMTRLRSDHFGPGHRGALLTTQFNVRRVQRHVLKHEGAKLVSENTDLIVSTNWDFHATDVLEDADGSLLVVDMGSWFNYGCPTQRIAKEEVTGAIYRARRLDAPKHDDPWGKKIAWPSLPVEKLAALLSDARHEVVARAVEELVKRGKAPVSVLTKVLKGTDTAASLTRREAAYALSRIGTPQARAAVRAALNHQDAAVREVAAHCVSVERDVDALPALSRLVVEDTASIRRKAAEALGRIGKVNAVKPLLQSVRKGAEDAFLQHSLIYALIQIGAFEATLPALGDADPHVCRAVLIALDQMNGIEQRDPNLKGREPSAVNPYRGSTFRYLPNEALSREHIALLLATEDSTLQLALLEVISRRPAWAQELVTVAAKWVLKPKLGAAQREELITALTGAAGDAKVQQFVADTLVNPAVPAETRREVFGVLARSRVQPQPQAWLDALEKTLRSNDAPMQREALNVVRIRGITGFDKLLSALAGSASAAPDVRLAATAILAPRTTLDATAFDRLVAKLTAVGDPMLPVTAATALGSARLTSPQRQALVAQIAKAGPLTLPLLVKNFYNTHNKTAAVELAKALTLSPGASALPVDEVEHLFGRPLLEDPEFAAVAKPLIDQSHQSLDQQMQYLAELGEKMSAAPGDPRRGEQVFFSDETKCSVCHVANGRGGQIGPDLSRIGSIRTTQALLESVVFPSSSIVPDFRSFTIELKNGDPVNGIIGREAADAIFLRTATLEEMRIARTDIESVRPSEISLMPQGLEKTITPQQLKDLLEFLFQLR